MHPLDRRLNRVAAAQLWLVTREQAMKAGLTARQMSLRLGSGALERLHKGVFALGGVPRSHEQQVLAACLAAGGVTRLGIIPVTRAGRTLLDVGAEAPHLIAGALEDVLYRGLESTDSLERLLGRVGRNGRRGTARIRRALGERDPRAQPTESALEDVFVGLLRRHRVRSLVRPYPLTLPDGRQVRLDFADPELKLDIEMGSRRWHSGPEDFSRDRRRDRRLASLGWTVLRYSWDDVHQRGDDVVEEVVRVRHALRRRAG